MLSFIKKYQHLGRVGFALLWKQTLVCLKLRVRVATRGIFWKKISENLNIFFRKECTDAVCVEGEEKKTEEFKRMFLSV